MRTIVILLSLLLPLSIYAQTADELVTQGQALEEQQNEVAAYGKYKEALQKDPNNVDALCGASYMASRIGNRKTERADKTDYFRKAEDWANKAIQLEPNNAQANYVKALAMGRIALIATARERVAASRDIKKHADLAIKNDPSHHGAWLILAKWHIKMANLSFAEKLAAEAIFGGIPKGASNEKAVECCRKAIELSPGYVLYYYELAQIYEIMDKDDVAIKILDKGLAKPNTNIDDPKYKTEMRAMKARLQG